MFEVDVLRVQASEIKTLKVMILDIAPETRPYRVPPYKFLRNLGKLTFVAFCFIKFGDVFF